MQQKGRTSLALGGDGGLLDITLDGAEGLGRGRVEDELGFDEGREVRDRLRLHIERVEVSVQMENESL